MARGYAGVVRVVRGSAPEPRIDDAGCGRSMSNCSIGETSMLGFAPLFYVAFRRGWEGVAISVALADAAVAGVGA